jgi:hypothetical protein
MTTVPSIENRRKSVYWLIIAALAVLVHLVLILTVRPAFFEIFHKSIDDELGASSPRSSMPQAIIVIPVELESDEGEVILVEPVEEPPADDPAEEQRDGEDTDAVNILDVVGESQAPMPATPTTTSSIVPPRPVEITWPETEKLGHCLGLGIGIRIRVGRSGRVLRVKPLEGDYPADCIQAAIDAAGRIKFRPGTADGKPEAMWTEIRIEFRRQRR